MLGREWRGERKGFIHTIEAMPREIVYEAVGRVVFIEKLEVGLGEAGCVESIISDSIMEMKKEKV